MKKIIMTAIFTSVLIGQSFAQSVYVGPKGVIVNSASNTSNTVTPSVNQNPNSNKNYVNCDLSGKNMPNTSFKDATFTNCDLSDSNFEGSSFENAVLTNVDLSGANLKNTTFKNATMVNVNTDNVKR